MTKWRRPSAIKLPGGFTIRIVYWSSRKIASTLALDGSLHDKDLLGFWDVGCNRIVINSSEPLWIQIKTLGHELVHAAHDYNHWLEQAYIDPIMEEVGETAWDELEDDAN